jgi:TRAP-type C4-dicarboxylate transport system substrate-binding protein
MFSIHPVVVQWRVAVDCDEMTIKKLELLADTSPALKVLNLPFTFWDVDMADPNNACG